ncbi:hypothetical protein K8354_02585 [Polaribacter litorisediminis]|uniref:hypothetical protein n=1 Tax=Polaribacter litorisediminis TaxID=1908341 RepID=UPI001CBA6D86|nr:hypothetical protein [Polaribacter litorisediminis]UAM98731.1 hypothetical protein K8354_02585 [Polaribacter litorisediminis]
MKIKYCILLVYMFNYMFLHAQKSTYVDENGVFKYIKTNKEVRLFGVNYTLPFAHGFRAINYLDKNHKEAIDKDVYHMARLGLDGYRVHIWDMEITDSIGNLIKTPQLDLLDYLFSKLKERGIKSIVTPFKVGGNGYPEKDFLTEGFSSKLGKWQTYAGDIILDKQERYFTQLLNHVNPYTNIAYKNDPDIIALEINNEPQHDNGKVATAYINTMVKVVRKAGFQNPIFYNVSERSEFVDDYLKADIQGCTFQWYPTGLVHNSLLKGNYLPNVDEYKIPFQEKKAFENKARIIYEFDSGDTNSSVIFPAMARSFREAKFQFATQFAYEPIELAFANTEYQTHYLNLAYTPSKAISLKIAGEVFREITNGKSFGRYPKNNTFLNTKLAYETDVAVYNSESKFFYTNTTNANPKNSIKLTQIAGIGNSEIVKYSGNGAYFLDKIEKGIWRLEVLPDVLWVKDPYEKASLKKTVAVLQPHKNKITINLKDLGELFFIKGVNADNSFNDQSENKTFLISPGTYIISADTLTNDFKMNQKFGNIYLNEFATTHQKIAETYVVHQPVKEIEKGENLVIKANIVSPNTIKKVEVVLPSGYQKTDNYKMIKNSNFDYQVEIPREKIYNDSFNYFIVVTTDSGKVTFPDNVLGTPENWDFIVQQSYRTKIVKKEPIVVLFDALKENSKNFLWPRQWNALPYKIEKSTHKVTTENYLSIYVDNINAKTPDLTFKVLVDEVVQREQNNLNKVSSILVTASSGDKKNQKVQVALQLKNGQVFGKIIEISSDKKDITIPFEELQQVPSVLLPRPFPPFQSYFLKSSENSSFDASTIEAIQISIGPGIQKENYKNIQQLFIYKILLK